MPRKKDDDGDELIWPHEKTADQSKLLDFIKELADESTTKKIEKLEVETAKAERIAAQNGDTDGLLQDMPEAVLDGRLGEICETYMLLGKRFPLAYAWPALLAVASVLVPRYGAKQRLNLYSALVGPVHSGKSQAVEAAQQLLSCEPPLLMRLITGSAEQLARRCKDTNGEPRLLSIDELGHLLEKSRIENASFPYVLNMAFYMLAFEIRMGHKDSAQFNAALSILGGLVQNRFEDLFSHATTAGLYDRFMFGLCPSNFKFSYFPFEAIAKYGELTAVGVAPDVWVEKEVWLAEDRELEPRVVEIAIRAATICASFDGKTLLEAKDLAAARALAGYEQRIRRYLKPNEGENPEAKFALKLMARLKALGGKYISKRELFHNCGAERCGPTIADRALSALHANGDIEVTSKQRPVLVRLLVEDEGGES